MSLMKEPIRVGAHTLHNRFVMAPVATELSDYGAPSPALFKYYFDRTAGGHVGLVVVEHNYISKEGMASPKQMSAADDESTKDLRYLADLIHYNGSKAILQINHAGAMADDTASGLPRVGPCDSDKRWNFWKMEWEPAKIHGLTKDEIKEIIQKFVDAALRAKRAGFDGCEIHSAHGFLLNEFFSPLTNHREDEYTGSTLMGRIRLHLEIIMAVREACGEDFLISMRFGALDYIEGGSTLSEAIVASEAFEQMGLDLIDLSGGMCGFTRKGHKEAGYFAGPAQAIKSAVTIPVVLTGGFTEGDEAEESLKEGKADLIGFGRSVHLKEDWPAHVMNSLQ